MRCGGGCGRPAPGHRPGHGQQQGRPRLARRSDPGHRERPAPGADAAAGMVRGGCRRHLVGRCRGPLPGAPAPGGGVPDRRRLRQRCRAVPVAGGRRRAALAPRDALRHRHACDRRDRGADAAVRRRGHPPPVRQGPLEPGRGTQAALGAPPRAGGLGPDPHLVRRQLLRGPAAHRGVRARPLHGEPVRPPVRPGPAGLGPRLGRATSSATCRCHGSSSPARSSAR